MKFASMAAAGPAVSLFLLAASPAAAQAQLGAMFGEMQAQHDEGICQANRRPNPAQRQMITHKVNVLMRSLHDTAATPEDLAKLFSKRKGAKVANTTQLISQTELRAQLSAGGGVGEWKHLVVGADHLGARGVWRIVIPGVDGAPETIREFGFDFTSEFGAWKVLHAQEYPGPLFAPEPDIFCHLATTASY